jgi:hypothetical protein
LAGDTDPSFLSTTKAFPDGCTDYGVSLVCQSKGGE